MEHLQDAPQSHVYHHSEPAEPRVNVKVERNTKGYNYEATVVNARTPEEALALLRTTIQKLQVEYGSF